MTTEPPTPSPLWGYFFRKSAAWQQQAQSLLEATPLFEGIPGTVVKQLIDGMYHRTYRDGEMIFDVGEPGLGMYLVLSGKVEVHMDSTHLAMIEPGGFFGEVALFGEETRTASTRAVGETELVGFFRPALNEWIDRSPRHGNRFLMQLGRVVCERLRRANQQLSGRG